MDDAGAMSVGQRRRHLDADVDRRRGVEGTASCEVAERPAVHELVGDEVRARRVADVVNRDDVRVIQRRRRPGFADESGQAVRVAGKGGWQHLQRHLAAEADVLSEIHLAHSALAEGTDDLVMPESCALAQAHGIGALYLMRIREYVSPAALPRWRRRRSSSSTSSRRRHAWPRRHLPQARRSGCVG